ncbi:redoxin family protein [Nocardioides sp. MAH-18]|uniref:Redoxin family protein n=1 Tax=Nocardioides agri TaxID=2682843 RepID=A0A6L6XTD0_9ACTN|nr:MULTISPECIES: TlpA disulfide reductase family protein [unclassified Nocardioides]MBA2955620.1 TlpA family protein disulfide reductase [Nocardioides sp. CGMCC 1.13656]MVQ50470.1 redoxin family protein [Nocardioides sp. MAH-18]
MRRHLGALACAALLLSGPLSGCSSLEGTGDKGFVSGDGTVRTVKAADRGEPVALAGEDLDGEPLDLADFRGKPTVVAVWGAWCGPCRAEAPEVVAAAEELDGRASFVGLNTRDPSTAKPLAFQRRFEVPYPSFFSPGGEEMLAFRGTIGPRSIPSFVVLDGEGRIAGSILGPLPSKQTLVDLVEDVDG